MAFLFFSNHGPGLLTTVPQKNTSSPYSVLKQISQKTLKSPEHLIPCCVCLYTGWSWGTAVNLRRNVGQRLLLIIKKKKLLTGLDNGFQMLSLSRSGCRVGGGGHGGNTRSGAGGWEEREQRDMSPSQEFLRFWPLAAPVLMCFATDWNQIECVSPEWQNNLTDRIAHYELSFLQGLSGIFYMFQRSLTQADITDSNRHHARAAVCWNKQMYLSAN